MVQYLAARHTMVAQNKVAGHTRAQNQADTRHAHTGETLHYCLGLPTQTLTFTSTPPVSSLAPLSHVSRVCHLSQIFQAHFVTPPNIECLGA